MKRRKVRVIELVHLEPKHSTARLDLFDLLIKVLSTTLKIKCVSIANVLYLKLINKINPKKDQISGLSPGNIQEVFRTR